MKKIKKIMFIMLAVLMLVTVSTPVTAEAASVKLNKTKVTLNAKKTCQLKISGTKKKVTWKSSKKSVATVNSKGKVTAKKKGTATITAKVSGKKYTCKVTVKQPVTKVTLNKTTAALSKKGATVTLKATATPSTANNKKVSWKSSNTAVAAVNSSGKVTAVANGTATITATAADGSKKKATCKVTVKNASATGHKYNSGEVTKSPTCKTTGTKVYTCTQCRSTKTETLPIVNHAYIDKYDTKTVYVWENYGEPVWICHCACGMDFNTREEWNEHAADILIATGSSNGHSVYSEEVRNDTTGHWVTKEMTGPTYGKCIWCGVKDSRYRPASNSDTEW